MSSSSQKTASSSRECYDREQPWSESPRFWRWPPPMAEAEGCAGSGSPDLPAIIRPSVHPWWRGPVAVWPTWRIDDIHARCIGSGSGPLSPVTQVLVEKSRCIGWKEYRAGADARSDADNVIIICSIENFDPMGVHTGDSESPPIAPRQYRKWPPARCRTRSGRGSGS